MEVAFSQAVMNGFGISSIVFPVTVTNDLKDALTGQWMYQLEAPAYDGVSPAILRQLKEANAQTPPIVVYVNDLKLPEFGPGINVRLDFVGSYREYEALKQSLKADSSGELVEREDHTDFQGPGGVGLIKGFLFAQVSFVRFVSLIPAGYAAGWSHAPISGLGSALFQTLSNAVLLVGPYALSHTPRSDRHAPLRGYNRLTDFSTMRLFIYGGERNSVLGGCQSDRETAECKAGTEYFTFYVTH